MRKLVSMLFVLVMLLAFGAVAEDLGVQIIGGPEAAIVPMTLDDLQVGQTYTIDGYAKITPQEYLTVDYFGQFNQDASYVIGRWGGQKDHIVYADAECYWPYFENAEWQDSGLNAEFAWLRLDVTNMQKKSIAYMQEATVKVVYADEYEFSGWIRQANFDYSTVAYRCNSSTSGAPFVVIHPDKEEAIDMMYTGTFIFGCTLPNSVIEDKASPLKMVIDLGGNELTYNIRK